MRTRISMLVERLQSAFWLLPSLLAGVVIGLAFVLLSLGPDVLPRALLPKTPSSIQGARLILSSIATATMTVVGVLFSLTIVVLQQVSMQYTPRAVENFIRSTTSQVVLGFFVGTFGYCLVLLRLIRSQGADQAGALYDLPVTVASFLAILCLGLLIYYLHHISRAIKSEQILRVIALQSVAALDAAAADLGAVDPAGRTASSTAALPFASEVSAMRTGYLQEVLWSRFPVCLEGAPWHGVLEARTGDFVYEGQVLARFRSARPPGERALRRLRDLFRVGLARTHAQDPLFGVRQLVDIALRALSPGINDPSTAVEAINEIGRVLLKLVSLPRPPTRLPLGADGQLTLPPLTARDVLDEGVHQICRCGRDFGLVLGRVESVLNQCRARAREADDRAALDEFLAWHRGLVATSEDPTVLAPKSA